MSSMNRYTSYGKLVLLTDLTRHGGSSYLQQLLVILNFATMS